MTTPGKATKEKSRQEWANDRKEIARLQLERIPELTKALFTERDLTSFLQLLSRIPYYSFQNLLIIYNKYPNATVLAGFAGWQRLMGDSEPSQKVLKPEAIKNGIDLILPFTNQLSEQEYELTWYSVLVFDIKQTNVTNYRGRAPVFRSDPLHRMLIRDAVETAIGTYYGRRIVYAPQNTTLLSAGIAGQISEHTVSLIKGTKDDEALLWLSEALCELELSTVAVSVHTRKLLIQYIQYCLYEMWDIEHPTLLPGSHFNIPMSEQALFLDLLQRTVFGLHQKIAGCYLSLREEEQELDDFILLLS